MRRFLIHKPESIGSSLLIAGSDAKHVCNVLRMKPGDFIYLFDNAGFDYKAKIVSTSPAKVAVSIIERFPSKAESSLKIILAQAFLKDRKMDTLVRHITELGVNAFIPFFAQRSVARPDQHRLKARMDRWKKIAGEALKQCGRGEIPEMHVADSFEAMLGFGKGCDAKIVFWENEFTPIHSDRLGSPDKPVRRIAIVLGPEGGFTKEEIEKAKSSGFLSASLGPRILKADTAAVAACALVQYLFGDMG